MDVFYIYSHMVVSDWSWLDSMRDSVSFHSSCCYKIMIIITHRIGVCNSVHRFSVLNVQFLNKLFITLFLFQIV